MLSAWYSTSNQQCKSTIVYKHSLTYPILIFDADISSILDKALHCVVMVFYSRNMQRSPLIKARNSFKKV